MEIKKIIEDAFENRGELTPKDIEVVEAVNTALGMLDSGKARVAHNIQGVDKFPGVPEESSEWKVNQWLKKAVLIYFALNPNKMISGGRGLYFDKVPSKFDTWSSGDFEKGGFRVVPPAEARWGSYVAPGVVLMPSYVNIGAYIDSGTMIDTWATVGSCAQIGKNCHISGGAGIGGVLEPLQANPVIIEDNCFIGARSEIAEGVIVEKNSVISMGVYLGQSTKIYNRETGEVSYGRIPTGSVVVSGNLPAEDGSHSLYCAVIVKQVDEKTRKKTSLNELLRL